MISILPTEYRWEYKEKRGSKFYKNPLLFVKMITEANYLNWYLEDPKYKTLHPVLYYNETFKLFVESGSSLEEVSPDNVTRNIINRYLAWFPERTDILEGPNGIESVCWYLDYGMKQDYNPFAPVVVALKEQVDVGGCVGEITEIADKVVIVSGIYHYSDGGNKDTGYAEPWDHKYPIEEFKKIKEYRRRYDGKKIWNAKALEPIE